MTQTQPEQTTARRPLPKPHPKPSAAPAPPQQSMALASRAMTQQSEIRRPADPTAIAQRITRPLPKPQPRALSMFESELLTAWATS